MTDDLDAYKVDDVYDIIKEDNAENDIKNIPILTISAAEYCAMVGTELSDYRGIGVIIPLTKDFKTLVTRENLEAVVSIKPFDGSFIGTGLSKKLGK